MPFAVLGTLLWFVLPERPGVSGFHLAIALTATASGAGFLGLAQVRRAGFIDALALLALALGAFEGIVRPLLAEQPMADGWSLVGLCALALTLREVALARWRVADWPRAQRAA